MGNSINSEDWENAKSIIKEIQKINLKNYYKCKPDEICNVNGVFNATNIPIEIFSLSDLQKITNNPSILTTFANFMKNLRDLHSVNLSFINFGAKIDPIEVKQNLDWFITRLHTLNNSPVIQNLGQSSVFVDFLSRMTEITDKYSFKNGGGSYKLDCNLTIIIMIIAILVLIYIIFKSVIILYRS